MLEAIFQEIIEIFREFFRSIGIAWDAGNLWARRVAILILVWPLIMMGIGLWFKPVAFAIALLPAIALIVLLLVRPLISAGIMVPKIPRKIMQWIFTITGIELAIGFYFAITPIGNDPALLAILALAIATFLLLTSGIQKKVPGVGFIKFVMVMTIIITTIILFFGGREEVKKMAEEKAAPAQKQIAYVEDGYYVTQNTVIQPYAKKPTTITAIDDKKVRAVINCDKKEFVADVGNEESVRVHHLYYGAVVDQNRCSFNPSGDAAPISGYPGRENLPRYQNDLPFQQFPAHSVVFYIVNERGGIITADYIKHEGGALNFTNYSGEKAQLYLVYNFSQALMSSEMAEQIGWDGSTATFEAVRY